MHLMRIYPFMLMTGLLTSVAVAQGMPSGGRPVSRAENTASDKKLKAEMRAENAALVSSLSKRFNVSEAALKNRLSKLENADPAQLKEDLEFFAAQLAEQNRRIAELEKRYAETGNAEAADPEEKGVLLRGRAALDEGDLEAFFSMMDAYQQRELAASDEQFWSQITEQLNSNDELGIEGRRGILNSYLEALPKGKYVAEARSKLATLEQDERLRNSRTPWLAGASKQLLNEASYNYGSVAFSNDGALLAAGTSTGSVEIWDVKTRKKIRSMQGPSAMVRSVDISPDRKLVLSASGDGTATLWDLRTGVGIRTVTSEERGFFSARFSASGKQFVTASEDTSVRVWDSADGKQVSEFLRPHPCSRLGQRRSKATGPLIGCNRYFIHNAQVRYAEFAPDDRAIAVAEFGLATVTDPVTQRNRATFSNHPEINQVYKIQFFPGIDGYATVGKYGGPQLWNAVSNRSICDVPLYRTEAVTLSVAKIAPIWGIATADNLVIVADGKCRELARLEGHGFPVSDIAISPNGKLIATGANDGRLILWSDQSVSPPN